MIRTQIRLHKCEYVLAKREAAALGISFAEFVRRALRQALPIESRAPWMRYAGFVESGATQSSRFVDGFVYDVKD